MRQEFVISPGRPAYNKLASTAQHFRYSRSQNGVAFPMCVEHKSQRLFFFIHNYFVPLVKNYLTDDNMVVKVHGSVDPNINKSSIVLFSEGRGGETARAV